MNSDYRTALLHNLAKLDQLISDAESLLASPGDMDVGVRADELRELLIEMRAKVEEKLDREHA